METPHGFRLEPSVSEGGAGFPDGSSAPPPRMRLSRWSIRTAQGLEEGVMVDKPPIVEAVEVFGTHLVFRDEMRSVSVLLTDEGWDTLERIIRHRWYAEQAASIDAERDARRARLGKTS